MFSSNNAEGGASRETFQCVPIVSPALSGNGDFFDVSCVMFVCIRVCVLPIV